MNSTKGGWSMKNFVRNALESLTSTKIKLPEQEFQFAAGLLEMRHVNQGQLLYRPGDTDIGVGIVIEGLVKFQGISHQGQPYIRALADEGSLIFDDAAEAVEDSWIGVMRISHIHALYTRHPEWISVARNVLQSQKAAWTRRELEFLTMSAIERYEAFVRDHSSIAARLSRQEIAAYVGLPVEAVIEGDERLEQAAEGELAYATR